MYTVLVALAAAGLVAAAPTNKTCTVRHPITNIQLGPRPYFLVDDMDPSPLKDKLASCSEMTFKPSRFSISHRGGGTLMIPEETLESLNAGTRMGAGVQECDVAFTKDKQLVCRHAQCDLHTTTNIVNTPLGAKCTQPFKPAADGQPASAKCCTSDISIAEFKTLCGKMDGANTSATTPAQYLKGTPAWRTDLYAQKCGTLLTHREFIKIVDQQGLDFTPELKTPEVPMPFGGNGSAYTQEAYAQQMIDEYKQAGISPSRVWPQSFLYADVLYWLKKEPEFAKQACLLDESADAPGTLPAAVANLQKYKDAGVQIMAPPLPYLVTVEDGKIVPSAYAIEAKRLGLKLITWSFERSAPLGNGDKGGYYYASIATVINNDGDAYNLLDVLARQVGVLGVFSDWSASVTYYANCFGLFP